MTSSSSQSTSILSITTPPFKHATHNLAFMHAQREWLQLGTTAFPDLSADSTLGTITRSASLAQSKEVDVVVIYGVLFDKDGRVGLLRDGKGKGKERAGSRVSAAEGAGGGVGVPQVVLEIERGGEKAKTKLKEAVIRSLGLRGDDGSKYGVIGTEDSVSLIKAILPVVKGPMVALVVRVGVSRVDAVGAEGKIQWVDRSDIEAIDEGEFRADGLKGLLLEAFEQREFEGVIVDRD